MASSSDSRVSSEHDEDQGPTRLSALYQYHNAPEVAPAHGLEYDDTVYPVSDKYPVVREAKFVHGHHRYTGKHAFVVNDNRPPRIIFGMKVKTFLVVAVIMCLVVVGAAVGGAVGGKDLHQGEAAPGTYGDMSGTKPESSTASPTTAATAAPTYSASRPTYTPLAGCSASADNTTYTSSFAESSDSNAGLSFTMYCNLQSPLNTSPAQQLAAAYVYSFADCADLCASLDSQSNSSSCTIAAYQPTSPRPANCWVGSSSGEVDISSLKDEDGTEVAILVQQR
ncbi:uncharacterized protein LTR77_003459 [Saxophila tyrrhenica]|uniref:Uncharacterized protein n=1 Tax=Saxophila tyrrhenica TaxID=1690608 RepID=A0AAV9PG91_9PEZI|nr:hypothetical protein LTR77_003459 [Saxophila tyrrhenica]